MVYIGSDLQSIRKLDFASYHRYEIKFCFLIGYRTSYDARRMQCESSKSRTDTIKEHLPWANFRRYKGLQKGPVVIEEHWHYRQLIQIYIVLFKVTWWCLELICHKFMILPRCCHHGIRIPSATALCRWRCIMFMNE